MIRRRPFCGLALFTRSKNNPEGYGISKTSETSLDRTAECEIPVCKANQLVLPARRRPGTIHVRLIHST